MRKLRAFFFLLLFSFQILPVKEVGELLYKSLIMEELHETVAHDDNSKLKRLLEPYHGSGQSASFHTTETDTYRAVTIHYSDYIPSLYTPEILTPPPNYC